MNSLIVDDDIALLEFLSQAVKARGHENVFVAASAEDALAQVVLRDYHLITLDIRMPGASGLEVLPLMRNMCPHAVIVIISGHIPEETIDNMAGCADVLLDKPVALETFFEVVDAACQIGELLKNVQHLGREPLLVRQA